MLKMCSKCGERPAIVFVSEMGANASGDPKGYCLVCAKEMGIKPINDMISKMNLSDEDIEGLNEQMMEFMDGDFSLDSFEMGGAPTFPFVNNIFGGGEEKSKDDSKKQTDKEDKKKRR